MKELEKIVLAYVIFDNEDVVLKEEYFEVPLHQDIVKEINILKKQREEVSFITISNRMSKYNKDDVLTYISSFVDYKIGTTFETTFKELKTNYRKRKITNILKTTEITDDVDIDAEKVIKQIQDVVSESNNTELSFKEKVINTLNDIEKAVNNKTDYNLYTGFIDLDKLTFGLHEQELTIIGARPGVGKTTFALQIATNLAKKGVGVGFVSLEMSDTQIIQKMIANRCGINSYKLRTGIVTNEELSTIGMSIPEIAEMPIYITTKIKTIQDIEVFARKQKNKNDMRVLIIDYIQLIKSNGKYGNREQEVADISRTLKLLSLELEIPIIALCQLNRTAESQEPTLTNLRESGALEMDADNIIFLYNENENKEEQNPIITVKLAKQRAGTIGKIKVRFMKSLNEFRSVLM